MSRYIPVRFYPDRMPIDISWVFANDNLPESTVFARWTETN